MFRVTITVVIVVVLGRLLFYWDQGRKIDQASEYVVPVFELTIKLNETAEEIFPIIKNEMMGRHLYDESILQKRVDTFDSLVLCIEKELKTPVKAKLLSNFRAATLEYVQVSQKGLHTLVKEMKEPTLSEKKLDDMSSSMTAADKNFLFSVSRIVVEYPQIGKRLQMRNLRADLFGNVP